jgi:phage tail-like protein
MPAKQRQVRGPVSFTLKIGSADSAGVFEDATGLDSGTQVLQIKRSMPPGRTDVIKVAGISKSGNIELRRGMDRDRSLWKWHKLVVAGDLKAARRDCTLTMLDVKGKPVVTLAISNAWPKNYTEIGLTGNSDDVAVEGITLCHEGFEIQ